jgi:AAA+ ATPase superfamily predicted ATPase
MLQKIIGRKDEIAKLENIVSSDHAELVAVYGRRRIGKTYLIKEFFDDKFDYYATGIFGGTKEDELRAFCDTLLQKNICKLSDIKSWFDAFTALRDYIQSLKNKKIIIFQVNLSKHLSGFGTATLQPSTI